MGKIIAQVKVFNRFGGDKSLSFSALVDTGVGYLTLPQEWRTRLGEFDLIRKTDVVLGNESIVEGEICGPIRIEVDQFNPIYGEVLFIPMKLANGGEFQPLLGYIPLEQIPVAVDMLGHRLISLKAVDCK